jgi:hypothetical protein
MFARKRSTTPVTAQLPAPLPLTPSRTSKAPRWLVDPPPRAWPRGFPKEAWPLVSDLFLAIARMVWWIVAALARLAFWIVRLIALGLGAIARAISGQRLRARGAEVVGWIAVVLIAIVTLTSIGFAHGWLPPHLNGQRHAQLSTSYKPSTPPPCVVRRIACTGPTETMDGLPSLSAATILSVLQSYRSPAANAGFANALYDLGFKYGVNPAYALAFFIEESSCGTQGIAATTLAIGNIRYSQSSSPISYSDYQGFRRYASWRDGAEDWFWLIRTYYLDQGVRDIFDVTPIYAPASDNNNPQQYAQNVLHSVMSWTK